MPITLGYFSIDRKLYRNQYCLECGHPFMAISDKYATITDGNISVDVLRKGDKLIETRCKYHYCKQYYNVLVWNA